MKDFDVLLNRKKINFHPTDYDDEIIQNVITICSTLKGSIPMDRDFGITPLIVDKPMAKEQARVQSEIISAVRKYEPRAEITKIEWECDNDVVFAPHVFFRVKS